VASERILTFQVCDDFRVEVGNKYSLIGCYVGSIQLHPIPSVIPKLVVVASVYTPIEQPFSKLVVRLIKGDQPIAELPFTAEALKPLPTPEGASRISMLAVLVLSPLPVEAPGVLRLEAETEEGVLVGGNIWIEQARPIPPAAIES
jgi:hypothetical protein